MTLKEAKKEISKRSINANLHYFISEWNDGYIIHCSSYMRRHPDTEFVYSTGPLDRTWEVVYSEKEKRFKHVIK